MLQPCPGGARGNGDEKKGWMGEYMGDLSGADEDLRT